jgi:hypothetical protein
MIDFSPGMRVIIRDEEWMVKKVETNSLGRKTIYCVGISKLVKDYQAIFLTDLEDIEPVDPARVNLVIDNSPFFRKSRLYIESQWRQKIPTDADLHIGNCAAMDLIQRYFKKSVWRWAAILMTLWKCYLITTTKNRFM